ncbi:nuclear transport factor 2 family protein [Mycobacterium sp. CVI_P3]|uniref:Nuclear transport factor 2 family protein n=1 Tax=Mycobacterium pinniadriaticum TaxID=2994102 RepID=A0ABT3S8S8_9MYCO|nr:nuclear transport factor 2 family protein [Mycobacterium pinniadriaticum]MCX2929479.1 nuclear transport factor 2 family protein [Mycobacterium pinniadriaticum]MCX2935903.1 nuclear transport factor 2 family protein [Mycobacterium pinniadriaticum]
MVHEHAEPLRTFSADGAAGRTDFDCRDRLAIKNLVDTYALAYDNYLADEWFELFTDEAVFVAGVPGLEPVELRGADFRNFSRDRMSAFRTSGNQRRHLMSNMVFLEQTQTTARASVVGLLTNTANGTAFAAVAALNYEGWFVKQNGVWKISRWHDFPDGPV